MIVFTHDLVFYHELWMAAASERVPMSRHWIRYTGEAGFGTILDNEEPWEAKGVQERLSMLTSKLEAIRRIDRHTDQYKAAVEDFYSDLRETWERLVEELLLNKVVGRFQKEVMTQRLKGVFVDDPDHQTVYFGMKKASEHSGHDRARGRQVAVLGPEEIKADLEELRAYSRRVKDRRKDVEATRERLEEPPSGTLS